MTTAEPVLAPGSTIGILGGGQLGRMLALAAAPLGLDVAIYDPDPEAPAFAVARQRFVAGFEDRERLAAFAAACGAITYEFENVPVVAAWFLENRKPVRPSARALAITQDRLPEKSFVRDLGVPLAAFTAAERAEELPAAIAPFGEAPAVMKTRRLGYDGKGQAVVRGLEEAEAAFARFGAVPVILEAFVPFLREVSLVAARGADGGFASWDLCENVHRDHILHRTTVPAAGAAELGPEAAAAARRIADALGYVGVIAVEFFVVADGAGEALLVNEIAPRVHNSGHWTIEGAETSQFEQHIRAVAGWPLGATTRRGARVEMTNLIGEEAGTWPALAAEPGAHLHLYGKREMRVGRKMGHVTRVRG